MKLYIMTDLHYYSRRNWKCDPYSVPRVNDQMQFRESEEILREAFDKVLADNECHTVLVTGDVTRNGEIVSHEDLIKIFEEYTAKGLKILAFTSTHDYKDREDRGFGIDRCKPEYIGYATGYNEKGEPERNVPCLEREDLRALAFRDERRLRNSEKGSAPRLSRFPLPVDRQGSRPRQSRR